MATVIDQLIVALKLDGDGFSKDANKAVAENDKLSNSIESLGKSIDGINKRLKGNAEQQKKSKEQADKFAKSINNGVKALTGLFSALLVSSGLQKLIDDTAKANDQLNFLSKNLGMSSDSVKAWQGAAALSGGSAEGMSASLSTLNKAMYDLVTVGDTSILPYFNALGVSVVKSDGQLRGMNDILLDLSDSMSSMSRPQAYNLAKHLGFDDGTINMLLQGRQEIERQLALQREIYTSSERELAVSRKLNETQTLVNRQWEGLKTIIGNYLAPYFLKFSEIVQGFFGYLNQHRDVAIKLFKGLSVIIGVSLIPMAIKAGMAFLGMFAPLFGGVGLVLLLAGAIALLTDDYNTWRKGGESLIDWNKWSPGIQKLKSALSGLGSDTVDLGKSVKKAFNEFTAFINIDTSKFNVKWLFDQITDSIATSIKMVGDLLRIINKLIDGDFSGAWDGMKSYAAHAAEAPIVKGAKELLNERIKNHPLARFWGVLTNDANEQSGSGETSKGSGIERPRPSKVGEKTLNAYKDKISETERRHGLPAGLLRAIAITESNGDPSKTGPLTSSGKAKGAFQFMDGTAKEVGIKNPYDFEQSLEGAGKYMASLMKQNNGDLNAALASYNWGIGKVRKYGMGNMPKQTREYIPKVRSNMPNNGADYDRIAAISRFNDQISRPLGGNIQNSGISDFMGQTTKLQAQPKNITNNNNTNVDVGGIVVQTTANTIKGISEDAAKQSMTEIYQMTPSVS